MGFLEDTFGKDIVFLAVNFLNYGMFLGGSLVKLPQVMNILRTMSVKGISESSVAIETLACLSFCSYNLLMGHPFKTWGEMAMITIQCAVQLALFWKLTDNLNMLPRLVGVVMTGTVLAILKMGMLPEAVMPILGLLPTVLGSVSRVPQILMNFQQKHTGSLSIFTWGLSSVGNVVRIATTLLTLSDGITLFGHSVAGVLNLTLVFQILLYWQATAEFRSKQMAAKKQ